MRRGGTDGDSPAAQPGLCFACERFIGPVEVCPYCGADAGHRPVLRRLRYAALALAGIGLIALHLGARRREAPTIPIGTVTPLMNFARVRIAGEVRRDAYVAPREGTPEYLSFEVADASGVMRVQAWRDTAAALVSADRTPKQGERVEAEGRLRVTAGREPRLALDSERGLRRLAVENGAP